MKPTLGVVFLLAGLLIVAALGGEQWIESLSLNRELDRAIGKMKAGELDSAYATLSKLAKGGHQKAQYFLGLFIADGSLNMDDDVAASIWLARASKRIDGISAEEFWLAKEFATAGIRGRGRSFERAQFWMLEAVKLGHEPAIDWLINDENLRKMEWRGPLGRQEYWQNLKRSISFE